MSPEEEKRPSPPGYGPRYAKGFSEASESSKVEDLNDTLNSRTRYQDPREERSPVRPVETPDVQDKWQGPSVDQIIMRGSVAEPRINPFFKKVFIFAILFFVATIVVAGVIFLGGTNFISSKNVDIKVLGPTTASAGNVLELGVTVKNENNIDLELANFSVQYPTGSRDPEDSGKSLTFSREGLGVIKAGEEATRNVRMILIGTTGEVKEVKFSVEYKVKGSNATFYKDKIYEITIGDAPLTLTVESPTRVTSGDPFTTLVEVTHNSTEVLKNVMLRAEYPYGFAALDASPTAIGEKNVWALGDFSPGIKRRVEIRGKLVGENLDERTFRFYAGVSDNGSLNQNFKSIIVSAQETIVIERPSLGLSISFNGESADPHITPANRSISTSIRYQNNLPEKLLNPRLEARFSGSALNKSSVSVLNGTYNPNDNRIVWVIANTAQALELLPGDGGGVNFSFSSLPQSTGGEITLNITLTGIPGPGQRPVTVTETRTVRIASQVSLSAKPFYSVGPFQNTGPIPPKAGATTTYTVTLNLINTRGDVNDAKVAARLGSGVTWSRAHSTGSESLSYGPDDNTVIWDLGTLSGSTSAAREVSFQVTLVPTTSQIGTAPVLATVIAFSGTDAATEASVLVNHTPVTTKLTSDPAFIQGDDIVRK